ncbi:probable LRR receptor-like serine/threonine-protein kinase At3g47570 [Cornus florida]|uniref:probable LRR receptor-like serine/threonine-protein kinase At3g47570 n=1 Tax=Cornus florida TaxID=4283 RepID=UPI0028A1CCD5|nr:probable LRR receptor-like serine/threonine-protein kinase At3g47570 [Cornus florida]
MSPFTSASGKVLHVVITIDLSYRGLVGSLSPYVGNLSFLRVLKLFNNTLQGEIPPQVGHLFRLQILNLNINSFEGEIPANLSHCFNLRYLGVSFNKLVGKLPEELGSLSKLTYLIIELNNLTGEIPQSIGRLSSLELLALPYNLFSGSLPNALGQLKNLEGLFLGVNQLSGTINPSIYNLSLLTNLFLADNHLDGTLSQNLGLLLPNLQQIQLWGNKFTGPIPLSISNCTALESLELSNNNFNGKLGINFGGLPNLFRIILNDNNLGSGEPDEMNFIDSMANCSNLHILQLGPNHFRGFLPNSAGNLSDQLRHLTLLKKFIHGKLPSTIGNLVNLNLLFLNNKQFTDAIPAAVENLQNLQRANLAGNKFHGEISEYIGNLSLLTELYLFGNRLKFCNLKNLAKLDISENELSGEIPNSLDSCTSLESLYMEGNFLEHFSLNNLNLSFNDFEGEVPSEGDFAYAIVISVVGNNRLCGGIPKLQLPKCNIKESKKQKSSLVLILAISILCTLLGVTMVLSFSFCCVKKKRDVQPSGILLRETFLRVSYEMLHKATDGFSSVNLIGVGSYGSVYKGILDPNETIVANLQHREASKSFMSECEALRNIKHRNLVKIITSLSSVDFQGNDFKALVYEFMPNGSLESRLHPGPKSSNEENEQSQSLNLLQRINVAVDVLCALEYLHHHCQTPIIHCDLKPSDVLLDSEMVAHVGDFGVARFPQQLTNPKQSSSIAVRGTVGYTAPVKHA